MSSFQRLLTSNFAKFLSGNKPQNDGVNVVVVLPELVVALYLLIRNNVARAESFAGGELATNGPTGNASRSKERA